MRRHLRRRGVTDAMEWRVVEVRVFVGKADMVVVHLASANCSQWHENWCRRRTAFVSPLWFEQVMGRVMACHPVAGPLTNVFLYGTFKGLLSDLNGDGMLDLNTEQCHATAEGELDYHLVGSPNPDPFR